ncbi:protein SUPPRESSOR OF GENE SILENCING 3-like [Bidens hawaiensis]|uniref:protein SUPPRESSOR OF GENE SILENCING 3-like n=1 Tax=Bidens hawaiensis TaxID=980011 RepID=UPI00404B4187
MSSNRGGGNGQSNKGKNRVGSSQNQNPWAPPVRAPHNAWPARTGAIPPPMQSGWNWNSRIQNNNNNNNNNNHNNNNNNNNNIPNPQPVVEDEDVEDDELEESDDDILSDEYDDEVVIPHEERKKNKWYAAFFETSDTLTLEQVNEPTRQWHCPACQNGPGAIDWYKSLQSLITHAKTKGSKQVKIHRDLAVVLEEELRIRGAAVNPAGELYGQWKGLNEAVKDKDIVWPPMVIIKNTQLEQDDNNKWTGMGNAELLDYFESYAAEKACHSYGPRGHMGMSVLIFQASAVGYLEAERLSDHFEEEGTDRNRWDRSPVLFYPGGKRKLYGYMATKEDMHIFNKHSHGKSKLKYEMVSYQENVVNQLKQMNEDHQQLHWYKDRAVKDKMLLNEVEKSKETLSKIVRKSEAEKCIVRERMQQFNEQKQEEIDDLERFLKDQLKVIEDAKNAKGRVDQMQMQHEERVTADSLNMNLKLGETNEFVE